MALLTAVEAGGQGVMMAPTEILARQHLEGLQPLAQEAGVVLELLTGRDKGRERDAKLTALAAGHIQILVGTHAVFQKDVTFKELRLAIVDEQHRFGVRQRLELGKKGQSVDVLVMTATPIPRSLALAQYGDMDVSILDEKPEGRQPIKTALISDERVSEVVNHLRGAIETGRQAYWVCPLVGESEVSDLIAAEERFKTLRALLGEDVTCLLMYKAPLSENGQKRLTVLRETEDGFKISETDLQMRGAGDLIGTAQSGLPKFRVADLESQTALMDIAQSDARKLLHDDPELTSERGKAARVLLWLMEQDQAIRLISVG